jgi:FHS family L-fucose permease-like MFS transporter
VIDTRADTDSALAAKFLAGAQAAFAVGRFAGVGLMHFTKPRMVFGIFMTMCIVFLAPSITQTGDTGMSMLYVTLFFESICFPTIFALAVRGLGRHSKRGSGLVVAGVIGGAIVPPLTGVAADIHGTGLAMVVPLCFFIAAWTYALAVNFVPWYRDCADAFTTTEIGLVSHHEGAAGELGPPPAKDEEAAVATEHGPPPAKDEEAGVVTEHGNTDKPPAVVA